ncbi:hypothetical protein L6R46_01985 [Myxococcota bacterium]|nr:hypothetical protein [Myxococcota bacterium]
MTPDWSLLAPHRPVDSGGDQYVPPPSNIGEAMARWALASGAPVLVGGPTGVGKSTELAQAAAQLQSDRAVCLIQLDRLENMRRLEPERMLSRVAQLVGQPRGGAGQGVSVSDVAKGVAALGSALTIASAVGAAAHVLASLDTQLPPADAALSSVRALARLTGRRVALLIDGLEKVPDGAQARALFDVLRPLAEEADLIAVAPWSLAFGAEANEPLVRQGERFFFVRAPEVEPVETAPGLPFLLHLLERRLQIGDMRRQTPAGFGPIFRDAAVASGGLPRVFLQLIADCATYARLHRDADWPELSDLEDAMADQRDGMRRGLLPKDLKLIQWVDGTPGLDLAIDAKVRLLAHGLLLERVTPAGVVLRPHPLLRPLLREA